MAGSPARSDNDGRNKSAQRQKTATAKEFTLSERDFADLRATIRELTGINMGDAKRELVYRRVSSRLKATGIRSFSEYVAYLKKGDPAEVELFSNAVTTNLTSFFREKHHFDYLSGTILPEIVAKKQHGKGRLRIWSAGCSTGEEPYSIAMTLRESFKELPRWDARVLCTDLDSDVLNTCRNGVYAANRVDKMPERSLRRWFQRSRGGSDLYKVRPELQELLVFKQLNLMHDWPMKGLFDVIFCRNVVIYFDKPTQRVLVERYAEAMEEGGYLILGHSESLFKVSDRFKLVGNTIYRKIS